MNMFVPRATAPGALEAVIRLNIESVLSKTGEWPVLIERHTGYEHSPGVMCWPVTYTTGPPG